MREIGRINYPTDKRDSIFSLIYFWSMENNMFTKLGNISGIYCIKNLIDMKRSVGQAQNLNVRARTHDSVLRSKKIKDSKYLQCAWNFYGEDNFEMYLVEECPIELLNEREEYWIKELHSHFSEWGYNLTWGGDGIRGHKHSPETRKKQSDAKKGKRPWNYGKKATQKAIRNQSIAHFGKHPSLETIQKMSKNNSGKNNPMYGKRGKQSPNWGKIYSDETIHKMSENKVGKKCGDGSSKYVGVSWRKDNKKFVANIRHMGKLYYLGAFLTEEEAAIAYNLKACELYNLDYNINQIK